MQDKAFLSGGDGVKRVSPGNVSQAYQDEDTAKTPAAKRKPKVKKATKTKRKPRAKRKSSRQLELL